MRTAMESDAPKSAIDVLHKANDKGEVGYAYGGDGRDWPAVKECLDRGWIIWAYDASPHRDQWHPEYGKHSHRRDVYKLTDAGYAKRTNHMTETPLKSQQT